VRNPSGKHHKFKCIVFVERERKKALKKYKQRERGEIVVCAFEEFVEKC
jgi:5-formaminoimidazole-4-carboxamide-1-beta-D-ribofuranosyl 5'-monophosphate synthetase